MKRVIIGQGSVESSGFSPGTPINLTGKVSVIRSHSNWQYVVVVTMFCAETYIDLESHITSAILQLMKE